MTDKTAYTILRELAQALDHKQDAELREALEAGSCALAAFVRIEKELRS